MKIRQILKNQIADRDVTPEQETAAEEQGGLYTNDEQDEPTSSDSVDSGDAEDGDSGEAKPAEPTKPETPVVNLSPEAIAQLRAAQENAKPKEEEKKQLSSEELDKIFRPVKVTPELLGSLGFDDPSPEQVAGFQKFAESIATHAVSVANVMHQKQLQAMQQQFEPLQQHYQEIAHQRAVDNFYGQFPELKPYDKIVRSVAGQIQAEGKTDAEVMKEVATAAKQLLQESGIKLSQAKTPGASHSAVPKPNPLAGTGRSAGSSAGGAKQNNPDADIYAD